MKEIIEQFLKELDLKGTEEEKEKLAAQFEDRVSDIVVLTMVENLTEQQGKEFLSALDDNQSMDQKIQDLAAKVPGLQDKIDKAIQRELDLIRLVFKA